MVEQVDQGIDHKEQLWIDVTHACDETPAAHRRQAALIVALSTPLPIPFQPRRDDRDIRASRDPCDDRDPSRPRVGEFP